MLPALRVVIAAGSVCLLIIGLIVLVSAPAGIRLTALWPIGLGAVGLVAITFERMRYHSEAAERGGLPDGPVELDSGPQELRFRPTDERFEDPTTRQRLRVWVDPANGERRYRLDD